MICTLLVTSLFLAACGASSPTPLPSGGTPYPAPAATAVLEQPAETLVDPSAYPAPGDPNPAAPAASDSSLQRQDAGVDFNASAVLVLASTPQSAVLSLVINLPSPCSLPRVVVKPPDGSQTLSVEVYSLVDGSKVCAAQLTPTSLLVPLGSLAAGRYQVKLNEKDFRAFTLK